jgi:IS605 OrfB family transposase
MSVYLHSELVLQNKSKFYSGKEARHKANRYQKARKTLQCKGTRSATRRLIAISGRERGFTADVNHTISKQIAKPNSLITQENLAGIRDRINSRTGKRASKKHRRANRNKAKWSFAELYGYIDYKAHLNGSLATKVPARYTSQTCVKCGDTSKAKRPNQGLLFSCECCGYELDSDLLGSRDIALRTLLVRQYWMSTGTLSMCLQGVG